MHRLTDAGKRLAAEALEADRERWGAGAAQAALDAFLDLDSRMKHVVTAWQMREVEGQQVLNDHADARLRRAGARRPRGPPCGGRGLARFAGRRARSAWISIAPDWTRPPPEPLQASTPTSPHRGSTATTPSGSSSTRTSSASPVIPARTRSPPAAPDDRGAPDRPSAPRALSAGLSASTRSTGSRA